MLGTVDRPVNLAKIDCICGPSERTLISTIFGAGTRVYEAKSAFARIEYLRTERGRKRTLPAHVRLGTHGQYVLLNTTSGYCSLTRFVCAAQS